MKKLLSLLILIISLNYVYGQASTRGALLTVDTSYKPTIKMLAVNVLDNEVVYWDLSSWAAVGGGGGGSIGGSVNYLTKIVSSGVTGNSGLIDDGTTVRSTQDVSIDSTKGLILNAATSDLEVARINLSTPYTGGFPFTTSMYNNANGDGTYNNPVVMGFNPYGSLNSAYGGNHISMESDYTTEHWKEFHYEVYNPGGTLNKESRLFSSTYKPFDSMRNATNQWDFRQNTFNWYTLYGSNPFAQVADGQMKMFPTTLSNTSGLQIDIGTGGTQLTNVGTARPLLATSNWSYVNFPGVIFYPTLSYFTQNVRFDGKVEIGGGAGYAYPVNLKTGTNQNISLYNSGVATIRSRDDAYALAALNIEASSVGINSTSPATSAALDVASTTKGFLPPRMTTAQRDAISAPAAGLIIYNTTTNKLNVFTTVWEAVTSL